MRVLILRTIAHNKIWEGNEPKCHYENQAYDIIKTWEPNIAQYTFQEINHGIGIYTKKYFEHTSHSGKRASTDTIQECQPSLLNFKSIEDNTTVINIYFELNKKFMEFEKEKMLKFDEDLLKLKEKEFGQQKPNTPYPSLCFTLQYQDVVNILKDYNITIN